MKIKALLIVALFSFLNSYGQSFEKLLYSKKDKPTVLINKNIIANFELIEQIPDSKIIKMEVMKTAKKEVDQYTKTYPNLSQYGLILVEMTFGKLDTKTQNEIRKFLDADTKTKIYVDGFLLMNEDYVIATKSIKEIEFISPNEQNLNEEKVINIWTLEKDRRLGDLKIDSKRLQEAL